MKDLYSFCLEVIGPVILMIAAVVGIVTMIFLPISYYSCNGQATAMNLPHSWGFWSGCMVTVEGKVIPLDAYINRTIEQNIRLYKGE